MQQVRIHPHFTPEQLIDRIKPQLLSSVYHADRIKNLVHIPLAGDVCLCWYSDLSDMAMPNGIPEDAMPSAPITVDLADRLGLSLEKLKSLGSKHSDFTCLPMSQVLSILDPNDCSEMDAPGMMVITNNHSFRGAAGILDPIVQEQLDAIYDHQAYYVIPSSVHEVLAIPKAIMDADDIGRIICDINAMIVAPEDRLSDSLYCIEDGKLHLVQ